MILGMTRAELGLTLFIFALIYGAGFLSRLGKRIGGWMVPNQTPPAPPGEGSEPSAASSDLPEAGEPR